MKKTKTQIKQEKYNARQAAKAVKLSIQNEEPPVKKNNFLYEVPDADNKEKIFNYVGDCMRMVLASINSGSTEGLKMAMVACQTPFTNRKVNDEFETIDGNFTITENDLKIITLIEGQLTSLWTDIANLGLGGNRNKKKDIVSNKIADFIVAVDRHSSFANMSSF